MQKKVQEVEERLRSAVDDKRRSEERASSLYVAFLLTAVMAVLTIPKNANRDTGRE
jgi:hypothetical protein